jgi:phospholipid/cholesterol/gamma-HCH transport system permease protein
MNNSSAISHTLILVGRYVALLARIQASLLRSPGQVSTCLVQLHLIGSRSIPVIAVAGFFTGMILTVQFHEALLRFGASGLLGSAVGLSLTRELGPLLAALIVIGRAGSASCAELAMMRTDQQIDAIECMGINSCAYLLAPRFVAFAIALPLLVAIFDIFGFCGGLFVATKSFALVPAAFLGSLADGVLTRDIWLGFIKSVTFGGLCGWLCLAKGYFNDGLLGAEGVSRTTTDAVVLASLAVLFADYIVGALMI